MTICKLHRGGSLSGFSINCGRHFNAADDHSKACCARDLSLVESLSEEEAVRRLKRWFVAGLHDHDWDTPNKRQAHGKLGGKSLAHFADNKEGWGELDNAILNELIVSI